MDLSPVVVASGAFVAVVFVVAGIHRLIAPATSVAGRIGPYVQSKERPAPANASPERERALAQRVDRVIVHGRFADRMVRDLARANLRLTVSEYLALHVVCALIGLAIGGLLARNLLGGLFFATLSLLAPRLYVQRRCHSRLNAFNSQLGDTLMLMANSLRSGYSLLQAMETVSREAAAPTSSEFARVVREVALGLTPEQALNNLAQRVASDDLEMVVTAINVQHEVGGNLSRVLDTISLTIRERVRIQGEIRSLTAQQRLSGYIIAAMPAVLGVGLFMLNPRYMSPLFSSKWVICGPIFLLPIAAAVMMVVGFVVIRRIVAIEV